MWASHVLEHAAAKEELYLLDRSEGGTGELCCVSLGAISAYSMQRLYPQFGGAWQDRRIDLRLFGGQEFRLACLSCTEANCMTEDFVCSPGRASLQLPIAPARTLTIESSLRSLQNIKIRLHEKPNPPMRN